MKVVIIGGGAAGMTSAVQIKKKNPDSEVVVFEKSGRVGWAGCPTPYWIQDEIPGSAALGSDGSKFLEKGITVHVNHEVGKIFPDERKVTVNGEVVSGEVTYDYLVLAMGARPFVPPIENYTPSLKNVFRLSHADDAVEIKDYLENNEVKRAIVVGGGFIGLEMVEAFKNRGLDVTLVEKAPSILPKLDETLITSVYERMYEKEIQTYLGTSITKLTVDDEMVLGGVLEDGTFLETDLLLLSIGVRPNLELAERSGFELNDGKLMVDEYFRTAYPNVFALGDLVFVPHQITKQLTYAPFGDVANKQAFVVADTLRGKEHPYKGVYHSFATSFFDVKIAGSGLSLSDALKSSFNAKTVTVKGWDKIHAFGDKHTVEATFVYDADTNKLLGSLFVGDGPVAQFNDQASLVIYTGLTIDELIHVDFGYSPTTSTVWNPLLALYRKVIK